MPASSRRPQISRDFLDENRRRRYVDAVAELLHEFGPEGTSVENIVRLAGTARNSFYEVFSNRHDCIGYGIGVAVTELLSEPGAEGEGIWAEEVENTITVFFESVASRPILAELFLVHAAACRSENGRRAALAAVERLGELFGRGRVVAEAQGLRPPPVRADEFYSRAVISLAARRVAGAKSGRLPAEAPGTAALVVGSYLGPLAADRVLGGHGAEAPRPRS